MRPARSTCAASVALAVAWASAASAAPHLLRKHEPEGTVRFGAPAAAQAVRPHLNYYGGPVLSSPKLVVVFWGTAVDANVQARIGDYYTALVQSPLFDWLNEYATTVAPLGGGSGTGQQIGHGSYGGAFTIKPGHTQTSLSDGDIEDELKAQLGGGFLPAPDADTLFVLHFPHGMKITSQGTTSCAAGGFCAYHSTYASAGGHVRYAVIPDEGSGSGCDVGCGALDQFNNLCVVASHEIVEATTDPDVGLASGNGPPLGWYDPQGGEGEIGDICNGENAPFSGADGRGWYAQREWSNQQGACILTKASTFSVSLAPDTQSVTAGAAVHYAVSVAATNGAPGAVRLGITGLPAGVSSSFDQGQVNAGQGTTLTLSTTSAAPNGSIAFELLADTFTESQRIPGTLLVSGGTGGGNGGACPSGTTDLFGLCVPLGCGSTAAPSAWLGLALLLLFGLTRRRAWAGRPAAGEAGKETDRSGRVECSRAQGV